MKMEENFSYFKMTYKLEDLLAVAWRCGFDSKIYFRVDYISQPEIPHAQQARLICERLPEKHGEDSFIKDNMQNENLLNDLMLSSVMK